MSSKSNSHHRRSIRLKRYDYSQSGRYFLTLCVKGRKHLFGNIVDGEMILNEAGRFARECWLAIPDHFPRAIVLEFVIMPNHVHGIIELKDKSIEGPNSMPHEKQKHRFQGMIPRSVSSIVKGFKIGVTKWFRANTEVREVWQRDYYEIVIRDEEAYHRIARYIRNNPRNWREDRITG